MIPWDKVNLPWIFWEMQRFGGIEVWSIHDQSCHTCSLPTVPQFSLEYHKQSVKQQTPSASNWHILYRWLDCKLHKRYEGSVLWLSMWDWNLWSPLLIFSSHGSSYIMTCFFLSAVTETSEFQFEMLWRMTAYSVTHSFNKHWTPSTCQTLFSILWT